jgi:hypothetical protein
MLKIRKIKRKDLDEEKYAQSLRAAFNYRIYAEAWYLDALTHHKWECLVLGDYEVIMPIPLQFKFGFKFVTQPIYCQQLGVFYQEEISKELFHQFEEKLHQYRVRAYHFNEENTEAFQPKGEKRTNFILDLNRPYEEIYKGFSKGTKWNLKQFEKSKEILVETDNFKELIEFKSSMSINSFSQEKLLKILKTTEEKNALIAKVCYQEEKIQAFGAFLKSQNRVIYINSSANEMGKKIGAPTGILNEIIRMNTNLPLIMDFEGSNLTPLYNFFKGFGGEAKEYTRFQNFK